MTADTLRRAAALMRENAEAATAGPWLVADYDEEFGEALVAVDDPDQPRGVETPVAEMQQSESAEQDAFHIASWHPLVALAVADWLDGEAADLAEALDALAFLGPPVTQPGGRFGRALAVANTYLGEER